MNFNSTIIPHKGYVSSIRSADILDETTSYSSIMSPSKEAKVLRLGDTQNHPIVISDSDSIESTLRMNQPDSTSIFKHAPRSNVSAYVLPTPPSIHRLSMQQLGVYNDFITHMLIDNTHYDRVLRKYSNSYLSTIKCETYTISTSTSKFNLSRKDFAKVEKRLYILPPVKNFISKFTRVENWGFRRLMRTYLNLYSTDCPFKISSTNRYTTSTYEAAIFSRRNINRGTEIKYLSGIRAILTVEEETELDKRGYDFSILTTSRNRATSYLFGPASYSNHDCKANSRLATTGPSKVIVIATRDIKNGEEITVIYGTDYFGERNCECRCKYCEDHG